MENLPIVVNEPTRRLWEPQHPNAKEYRRYNLETPWNAERRGAVDVRTPELNKVLQHDTPGDRPLLHGHKPTMDRGSSDLGLVDGYDTGRETDGNSGDDTTHYQHTTVLARKMRCE